MPCAGPRSPFALRALIDEVAIDAGQILSALLEPALRLGQGSAHQQRLALRTVGRIPPRPASGFQPGSPGQELALGRNPFPQLFPAPEDCLVRDLRVGLAGLGCCSDEQAVWVIGELAYQPPFLVRELGARCAPPRRLLALAH